MARTDTLAQDLGRLLATDEIHLEELLPEIVTRDGRLWSFGRGLAEGASDREMMWNRLVAALAATEESLRRPQVLGGFLRQARIDNPVLTNKILDAAVDHSVLSRHYPLLQVSVELDEQDVARLKRSVTLGRAPSEMYRTLAGGRATDPMPTRDLKELILLIAAMPSGYGVAIEILYMRLFSDRDRTEEIDSELSDAGCDLLQQTTFNENGDHEDLQEGSIARSCLKGKRGTALAFDICKRLKSSVSEHHTSAFHHNDLLDGINIIKVVGYRKSLLANMADDDLISWCDQQPTARYPAISQVVPISRSRDANWQPSWTSIAWRLLEKAPSPSEVLRLFVLRFMPSGGWSGSLSAVLESNATLLDQLEPFTELSDDIDKHKEDLKKWIDADRRRENAVDQHRDERFE